MRKKLTPIFRQISDAATPKLVKRMAEISPVHSLLDKLLEGSRRRIQAASLACCSSWSIVFHELILPLTELRHIPPFTEPVWATQMVSSALVRKCCLFIVVCPFFFLLVIRWNPDLFFVSASVFGTVEPPLHYAERSRQGHKTTKGEMGLCAPSVVLFVIFIRRLNLLYVVDLGLHARKDLFGIFFEFLISG